MEFASTTAAPHPFVRVIVNPISGRGRRDGLGRARADQAVAWCRTRGIPADVHVTEGPAHGARLAGEAAGAGAAVVIAWGGDGTVNEVGAALAGGPAALGIVPSGSGNGLARTLAIPADPAAALAIALDGVDRCLDAGELDGRLFFNVAGVGFDARVAHRFARNGGGRRGLARYVAAACREALTYSPDALQITTPDGTFETRPLLVTFANAREWGNGAIIAPGARPDDGRLDLVIVEDRSWFAVLRAVPRLFDGSIGSVPGVRTVAIEAARIAADGPIAYHVDGEPGVAPGPVQVRVRPGVLRVRVSGQSVKR